MCGIVAIIHGTKGAYKHNDLCKFIQQACVTGVLRGTDSTGVFQVDHKGNIFTERAVVSGSYFGELRGAKAILDDADSGLGTVLHHRKATAGSINYANCHPFEHDIDGRYLIGVHNGTLHGTPSKEDGIKFDVDSDYLLYSILKNGGEMALGDISGAYATVWYQDDTRCFYVAANGERNIYWAAVKDSNTLLMASESGMLYWLAQRNSIKIEQIFYPTKGKLFKIDPEGDVREFKATDIIESEHTKSNDEWWDSARAYNHTYSSYNNTRARSEIPDTGIYYDSVVDFMLEEIKDSGYERHVGTGDVLTPKGVRPGIMYNLDKDKIEQLLSDPPARVKVVAQTDYLNGKKSSPTLVCVFPSKEELSMDKAVQVNTEGVDADKSLIPLNFKGPEGKNISKAKFEELTKHGCGLCSCDITHDMNDRLGWYNDQPVCMQCYEDEQTALEMSYK